MQAALVFIHSAAASCPSGVWKLLPSTTLISNQFSTGLLTISIAILLPARFIRTN